LLAVVFAVLAVCSFADAGRLVRGARRTGSGSFYFDDIEDLGGNAAGYLATYLLPFLGLVPTGWGDWASYGVYLLVAAIVFIRTDLSLVNPTLYLYGWRVVSARAFLTSDHSPEQQIGATPLVIVCRDPAQLANGPVDVVALAGSFITKRT
jgi:hypothetical protein